jgi:hypothetical protein
VPVSTASRAVIVPAVRVDRWAVVKKSRSMGVVIGDCGWQGARSGLVPGVQGRSGNAAGRDLGAKTAIRNFFTMA